MTDSTKRKIAIKLNRVYFDNESGVAEIQICDPELIGEDINIKLRPNEMQVVNAKEWFEVGSK